MKIAVISDKASLNGSINNCLSHVKTLLIIEMNDDPESAKILKSYSHSFEKDYARIAVSENCEAMICGVLSASAYAILADRQITRYDGSGMTVFESIKKCNTIV